MPGPFSSFFFDPLDPQAAQDVSEFVQGKGPAASFPEKNYSDSNAGAGEEYSSAVGNPSMPTQTEARTQASNTEAEVYNSPPHMPSVDGGEGNRDTETSTTIGAIEEPVLFPGAWGPGIQTAALQEEGYNYFPVGGRAGKEMVQEAFVNQPKKLTAAVEAGAQAQTDEAEAKKTLYANERDRTRTYEAALKEQYMLRQEEMMQRQQELEKRTQQYTNDLADKGAFWHNPQNIIAAMGAALMQITTDDRSFGYKLLNGAIQADLQNRRALADSHLGYLKSNMHEYDKIAGSRIQGMQLAELEAKRVAAMELERISQQFVGPKAKANAAAINAKIWSELRQGYMQFYRNNLYVKPHLENRQVLGSYKRGGEQAPGVGYSPFADHAGINSGPSQNQNGKFIGTPGGVGGGTAYGASQAQPGQPNSLFPQLTPEQARIINERYEGGATVVANAQKETTYNAYLAAGVRPGTPTQLMSPAQRNEFNSAIARQRKEAYEALDKSRATLEKTALRRSGLRLVQSDMSILEGAIKEYQSRGLKLTMDDLLSTKTRATVGGPTAAKWQNIYDAWAKNSKPENKWKYSKEQIETAGDRLNQLFAGQVGAYNKEIGGAALTEIELPRLEMYASPSHKYSKMRVFIDDQSRRTHSLESEQLKNMPIVAQAMWHTRQGVGAKKLESPSVREYETHESPSQEESLKRNPKTGRK